MVYKNKISHSGSLYVPGENITKQNDRNYKGLIVFIFLFLMLFILLFSCTGCSRNVSVNVENEEEIYNDVFGQSSLISIGDGLVYDSTTRIVYFYFYSIGGYGYMSAYYAPNGLPYKYNPETDTFEEIGETQ